MISSTPFLNIRSLSAFRLCALRPRLVCLQCARTSDDGYSVRVAGPTAAEAGELYYRRCWSIGASTAELLSSPSIRRRCRHLLSGRLTRRIVGPLRAPYGLWARTRSFRRRSLYNRSRNVQAHRQPISWRAHEMGKPKHSPTSPSRGVPPIMDECCEQGGSRPYPLSINGVAGSSKDKSRKCWYCAGNRGDNCV